ncbi:LysR substrate-binding domain-containing protein [Aquicoccus porphyridii]|uniref:LysR family transcriptional regulator n=1 Tax=Aquicoccus porphyridii TaxID=1852029 RepID=A0A5A9ZKG1_9RHOB|nr:LysR substrate-binding domain-containing protein [Aquicoccus porphyridii]KAA0917701.1 LysR family transcriptional regulator [Aquicoccus porphyridii]RAI55775.1 LysR family transcriptional regulator [Rhodobacteraceae bacterium AsT-22]
MDTRQLETLLAVQQHGGFAAAAQAVNLTASAISQQIAALEAELGTQLFDRSRRPPVLTAKGAEMVRSAQSILQIVRETKASVGGGAVRGTMAFGSLRTGANSLVPKSLATLRVSYPDLHFRLRVGMSEELMSEVVSGQLDAALVADHVAVPSSLRWTPVMTEPLIVLTPPGTGGMSVDDLIRTVPYIRYRSQVPLARQIDTEIARFGGTPRQILSVNTMPAVVGCVRAGLGFAIVPQVALQDMVTATLDWFPFGSPSIHRRLGVVQRATSRREEILVALVAALTFHGRPRKDYD